MCRLHKLVKQNVQNRNSMHQVTDVDEYLRATISYIALQEGISPTTLYIIYTMNGDKN